MIIDLFQDHTSYMMHRDGKGINSSRRSIPGWYHTQGG